MNNNLTFIYIFFIKILSSKSSLSAIDFFPSSVCTKKWYPLDSNELCVVYHDNYLFNFYS